MTKHVTIVEDDPDVRAVLARSLGADGYQVTALESGAGIEDVLAASQVDLLIIDIGLPDIDGLTITQQIRRTSDVGIIIVSGRGDLADRVVGLEIGADDYITKPFEPREILARVRSVLRRTAETSPRASAEPDVVRFAGFRLDLASRELTDPRGEPMPLTTGEFDLLSTFVAHPNRVLTRDDLMSRIHGREAGPYDRAIDVQIGRLRRKVEIDAAQPTLIKSVRGAGYIFTARVERG